MTNKLAKKVACVLCVSSIMSLTTVESMLYNSNDKNDGKELVTTQNNNSETPGQDNNNENTQIKKAAQNNNNKDLGQECDIENGLLGVKRDIFLNIVEMVYPNPMQYHRELFGISGEFMTWINHFHYAVVRNIDSTQLRKMKRMCRLLTKWQNLYTHNLITENSLMVSNRRTVVVTNDTGIFCRSDGITYKKTNDSCVDDIIVADGKYVAINDKYILTSDDGRLWKEYENKKNIIKISYDEVTKTYHGIDKGTNIYGGKDIAALMSSEGKSINADYLSPVRICSGNDIVISSLNSITIPNSVDEKTGFYGRIYNMSYNKVGKCIVAVTDLWSINRSICTIKNGGQWKKEFEIYNDSDLLFSSIKPVLATIDNYSVLLIQHYSYKFDKYIINIFIRKNDPKCIAAEWMEMPEIEMPKIGGKCEHCQIKQLVDTGSEILMLTDKGIKQAVGNIMPTLVVSDKNTFMPKPTPTPTPTPEPEPEDDFDDDIDFANE